MADLEQLNGIDAVDFEQTLGLDVVDLEKINGVDLLPPGPYWRKVHTITGVPINALAVDTATPNHNLVAAVGSITPRVWYCNNGGKNTWVESSETFPSMTRVVSVIDQPTDDFMLAGVYDTGFPTVFKSTNGGQTWTAKNYYDTRSNLDFEYDPSTGYMFMGSSQSGKVWRSIDDGETFVEMQALADIGGFVHTICYDSTNGVLIAGGGSNGADIWKSTNDGVTWVKKQEFGDDATPPGTPNISAHVYSISHDPFHDTLIACAGAVRGQIWVSANAGETWTKEKDLWTDSAETAVLCSVYDPTLKRLWAGTYGRGELWYSDDGGYTWTRDLQLETSDDVRAITCLAWDISDGTVSFGTSSNIGTNDGTIWLRY